MSPRLRARAPGLSGLALASIGVHLIILGTVAGLIGWFGGDRAAKRVQSIGVEPPSVFAPIPSEPESVIWCGPDEEIEPQVQPVAEEFPVSAFEALVISDEPSAWLQVPPRQAKKQAKVNELAAEPQPSSAIEILPNSTAPSEPTVQTPPSLITASCPAPEYPQLARRRAQEGTVWLRLRVTSTGLPAEVILESSSGHALLDEAALSSARAWKLLPATLNALPVEGTLRVPVTFRIDKGR